MPKIKAIKIDPFAKTVTEIQVENSFEGPDGMYKAMNTDIIEHYWLPGQPGQVMLLDEEGQYRKERAVFIWGFLTQDNAIFMQTALIVGFEGEEYCDTTLAPEKVRQVITFPKANRNTDAIN